MKCLFVSDVHGKTNRYKKLFQVIGAELPDGVFLGGDILPNQFGIKDEMENFIEKEIFTRIKEIKNKIKKDVRFFIILGNDDPKIFEKSFIEADEKGLIDYIHNKTVKFDDFFVTGYSYVPPTPFQLKDWEKYDVSRFLDVGAISPEDGVRTVDVSIDVIKYSTIAEDLEVLSKNTPVEKTIFLFHAPPYKSNLDRAELDNKSIDHAPLDVHIGSIAIQRFIKKKHPFLTLHGHIHESVRLTGSWIDETGKSFSFSAAHNGPELALVRFDTDNLHEASRDLIKID